MGLSDVEQKKTGLSNGLWQRQAADFPELPTSGRHESRTAKYDIGFTRY